MAFSISPASISVLPLTAYSICNTQGFTVSTVRRNFERSPPVRAAIVDRADTRSTCTRPRCDAGLLRAQLKAVQALNIILTRGPFSRQWQSIPKDRFYLLPTQVTLYIAAKPYKRYMVCVVCKLLVQFRFDVYIGPAGSISYFRYRYRTHARI